MVVEVANSTQDLATQRLRSEIDVFLAKEQTGGRGRHGRPWFAGSVGESLSMSIVFRSSKDHPRPWLLGMACAVAVASVVDCRVQWPNDLVIEDRKLGGILTEVVEGIPIVGIGLNLNQTAFPPEIADRAISLRQKSGQVYEPLETSQAIVRTLTELPAISEWRALEPLWSKYDQTPGKAFMLTDGRSGIASRIGQEGELIVAFPGGEERVLAADAWFSSKE